MGWMRLLLEFPGLISLRQDLWNPVPGTLPGIGMNSLGGPRPLSFLAKFPARALEGFCQSTHAFQRALAPSQSRPLREYEFLSLVWFPSQAQPCWAHKSPSSGLGGGGVALLHGKIKPFVREQGPTIRQANRVGAQGGQVALFGITDIALRCSGTLKITLSQPN